MLEGIIFLKCLTPDKASSQICSMSLQMFFLFFFILRQHFEFYKTCLNWVLFREAEVNGLKMY